MQTRTKIISATLTAAAVLGLAGTGTAVALDKTVTLRVGEQTRQVSGFGLTTTVGDVLRANGVTLEGRDSVSPAVDTAVANGQTVTVTLRRPVLVSVTRDGITSTTLTYATTVAGVLTELGVTYDADDRLSVPAEASLTDRSDVTVRRVAVAEVAETVASVARG